MQPTLSSNVYQQNCFWLINILEVPITTVNCFHIGLAKEHWIYYNDYMFCKNKFLSLSQSRREGKRSLMQKPFDIGQYQRSSMNNHKCCSNNRMIDWAIAPHCLREHCSKCPNTMSTQCFPHGCQSSSIHRNPLLPLDLWAYPAAKCNPPFSLWP